MVQVLTMGDEQFFRSNYHSMLRQSRIELSQWHKTKNIVFLQQACEKVFNAMEQFVQVKSKSKFESHSDFRTLYRQLGLPNNLLYNVEDLHKFFYNGEAFEKDLRYVEEAYTKVYNYLKNK